MFDAKDVISDAVARSVKLFATHRRGDVIPWQEIEAAAGFDRESSHWTQFSKRSRRDFRRKTGIVLWPVNGVGLRLLTISEHLHMRSIARHRRALRQLTRDVVELKSLPDRELTQHEREVKYRKIDKARAGRRAVLHSDRVGHLLARPSSAGLPRGK